MTTVVIAHPKGGVGRSTTAYFLGIEIARQHPEWLTVLDDQDQGRHLSRICELLPPAQKNLWLLSEGLPPVVTQHSVTLVDTAPEASFDALARVVRLADWLLVPVKGPELGSVQVLFTFLRWFEQQSDCRLLGFLPTMYKPRRQQVAHWMAELRKLADQYETTLFDPIPDSAAIGKWSAEGHPYATLARMVAEKIEKESRLTSCLETSR